MAASARTGRSLVLHAARATVVLVALTGVWGMGLLLMPDQMGTQVLGATWDAAAEVLPATAAQWLAVGAATGAALALKALARGGALLRVALVQAPVALLAGTAGAALDGARGAAAGLALAQVLGAAVTWWWLLGRGSDR
jgi:hypothetical protein